MKATINANGILVVEAETDLEAYALKKWSEDNFQTYPNNMSEHVTVKWGLSNE